MQTLVHFLQSLGTESMTLFWLPVAIWTFVAIVIATFLKLFKHNISTVYQYHSRVALLWGLAGGVLGSIAFHYFPIALFSDTAVTAKFIVIQNPIAVTASLATASINFGDPMIWIGLATVLIGVLSIIALVRLLFDFKLLKSFTKKLPLTQDEIANKLNRENKNLLRRQKKDVDIHFSRTVDVPCTFGWYHKHIVLPTYISDDTEKLNMAIRHELTHIANNDYLINASIQFIKALFFVHPVVHKLAASIEEHREMYCDQHVLQDASISQKNYAKLLLELSPKPVFKTAAAVNMAVQPSTLKKRIKTMKSQTTFIPSLKWSFSLMLIFTLMITGLMACSDIEEGGITRSEVQEVQSNAYKVPTRNEPLYLINGKKADKDILSRLKPKYIKSINVLKDKSATDAYGDAGKNGVVKITLKEKETALNDLLDEAPSGPVDASDDFFIAVENPPQLKGGLKAIQQNVTYPESCKQAGIEGRVTVKFIVNKQGEPENLQIIRGIGGGCDEAALEAVEKYAEFTPGTQKGKKVKVQMSLPVLFKLASK